MGAVELYLGERRGRIGLCDPTQDGTCDVLPYVGCGGKAKGSGSFVSDCGVILM